MLPLADVQQRFARAMTTGEGMQLVASLRGGSDPGARLAIHLRHYANSLASALRDKFPALTWLVGDAPLRAAAIAYARLHPPLQPCIAEYGRSFPRFLSQHARGAQLRYLQSFGELEWAIAQASLAIEERPLTWAQLANLDADRVVDAALALQPGMHYVRSAWRIDELMQAYLSGATPERFVLTEAPALLEVQGARGAFRLSRLDAATFAFRTSLAPSRTIGEAGDAALAIDSTFDAGEALRAIVDGRLATRYTIHEPEVLSR